MEDTDQGRARLAVVVALVVVSAALVIASGFVFADDQRTGEEVLEDVQEKYNTADSVSAETVVTLQTENETAEFEADVATAGEEKFRLNISDGNSAVLTGTDGEAVWIHDPERELTGVVSASDQGQATVTILAGTNEPSGLGLSAVLPVDDIDQNTTVGELLTEVEEEELPPELREEIGSLPENTTLGEAGDEFEAQLENVSTEEVDVPEEFNETTVSASLEEFELPDEWADEYDEKEVAEFAENLEEVELPDQWEGETLAERWAQVDLPAEWENSEWAAEIDEFSQEYDSVEEYLNQFDTEDPNLTVELVGTTTIRGQEANELRITHPELAGETRLYTGVESDELLEQRTTTETGNVTVELHETRFNVAPAESTFLPPGDTEIASASLAGSDDKKELVQDAPLAVAVPDGSWTFEHGGVVTTELGNVQIPELPAETRSVTASYTSGDQHLLVSQSDQTVEISEYSDTVRIRGQEVAVSVSEQGAVATWTEAGTTTTVAGNLTEAQLVSTVEDLTFEN